MDSVIGHDFYYDTIPSYNVEMYRNNMDETFTLIDTETYEEFEARGSELYIKDSLIRDKERELYKVRKKFKNGVYIVSPLSDFDLKNLSTLLNQENYFSENAVGNVANRFDKKYAAPLDIYFDTLRTRNELLLVNEEHNVNNYFKYVVKAFYYFSELIQLSKSQEVLMLCRHHYSSKRYENLHLRGYPSGTGGSFGALFNCDGSDCTLTEIIGLTEEY